MILVPIFKKAKEILSNTNKSYSIAYYGKAAQLIDSQIKAREMKLERWMFEDPNRALFTGFTYETRSKKNYYYIESKCILIFDNETGTPIGADIIEDISAKGLTLTLNGSKLLS